MYYERLDHALSAFESHIYTCTFFVGERRNQLSGIAAIDGWEHCAISHGYYSASPLSSMCM
jgi:hypothetical protein